MNARKTDEVFGPILHVALWRAERLNAMLDEIAGGPRYLHRFATERTVSTDTTAACRNATLLSLGEETETVASQDSRAADMQRLTATSAEIGHEDALEMSLGSRDQD